MADALSDLGESGGSASHTLTESEMPEHTHIQNRHIHYMAHMHHLPKGSGTAGSGDYAFTGLSENRYSTVTNSSSITTLTVDTGQGIERSNVDGATPEIQNTGGGEAHNNVQPSIVLNYIIKT